MKTSVNYEDLRTVIQLLKKGDYVFPFDIKSGYYHIDIFEEHRKYLSFCWQFEDGTIRYFHFNVLPFGLSPAPYVFTKAKLCANSQSTGDKKGIRIVLYIDDGLGGAGTFNRALAVSQQVKSDLISCGFTPNQKFVWIPTQELIWLGHVLNFREATITVTQEKILKPKQDISFAVSFKIIKAQKLATIAGQIISMSMTIGNLTRLMTRSIFSCITRRKNWSSNLQLDSDALNELNFW